jgi:site-specific DNA recombinase
MRQLHASLRAALYARVSSDHQAEEGTIDSQVEAVRRRAHENNVVIERELEFLDDGHSGNTLLRPALERLRDQAAAGAVDRLYVLAPDRLARNFALQYLLIEELRAAGVEVVFVNRRLGQNPEDNLLLQVQGMIAEYERAKIIERARRGKHYAARQGRVSVLAQAPYGYRYIRKTEGTGTARFDILLEEARVVRQIFTWIAQDRLSLREICKRLQKQGIPTRTGKRRWSTAGVRFMLRNTSYIGEARYGKTRVVPRRPQLRPQRHQPDVPRCPYSISPCPEAAVVIAVPAIISAELFAQAGEQLDENQRRTRVHKGGPRCLLQGLLVCRYCGYACTGFYRPRKKSPNRPYGYYRCCGRSQRTDEGHTVCQARQLVAHEVETAVWNDVCDLLTDPRRVEQEYERRLQGSSTEEDADNHDALGKRIASLKRAIARLIDSYSEGLLEKEEFEPRLRTARERLSRLEAETQVQANEACQRAELRLVLGKLQEFAEQIQSGLHDAPWKARREVVRALVKQIEVSDEEIRVVYRVPPVPFVERPTRGVLQDCSTSHRSMILAFVVGAGQKSGLDASCSCEAGFLRGRPRWRRAAWRPSFSAVIAAHSGEPKGLLRTTARRTASSSASVCGVLTMLTQSGGIGSGQASKGISGSAAPPCRRQRLPQRQFSAREQRLARKALRST